jgi:hypothetical protein
MRRLYFLVPEASTARKMRDDLLLARIQERHIHVLAKRGRLIEDLPEASVLQKTNFVAAAQRGLAMGGMIGTLAGLVPLALLPAGGTVMAGGILLGSALAGAGVGAWTGGMVGMNVGNTRLKQFEDAIERGQLLIMVDVPAARVQEINQRIRSHHPLAEVGGTEPSIPAFP